MSRGIDHLLREVLDTKLIPVNNWRTLVPDAYNFVDDETAMCYYYQNNGKLMQYFKCFDGESK